MRKHLNYATRCGWTLIVAATLLSACGGKNKNADAHADLQGASGERARLHDQDIDLFQIEPIGLDVNGDGQPDVFRYMQNGVVRIERYDLDFDGDIDAVVYYGPQGELQQQDFYLDNDDLVDSIRLFENQAMVEKRMAIAFDETFPLTKYYDARGDLLRVEHDTDGSGFVDMWSYYEDGRLVRVARDTDGDGIPDTVSEIE